MQSMGVVVKVDAKTKRFFKKEKISFQEKRNFFFPRCSGNENCYFNKIIDLPHQSAIATFCAKATRENLIINFTSNLKLWN